MTKVLICGALAGQIEAFVIHFSCLAKRAA